MEPDEIKEKIAQITQKINQNPRDAALYLERAALYCNLNNNNALKGYDKALADYNKAIELNDRYAAAYNNRGSVFANLKEYAQALTDFNKALELNDCYSMAYHNRGKVFYALKDYDRALADFNKVLSLDGRDAAVYNNRGSVFYALKDYDRALIDFNKALELDNCHAMAYNNRGIVFNALKDYDRALADFNKALGLDDRDAAAYNNRGTMLANVNHYKQALADFNKALELDDRYAMAYYNRGNVFANVNHYEQALADFNKALELDDLDAEAYNNRGNVFASLNYPDLALTDFNKALELDGRYATAYNNRGNVFYDLKNYDQALADYERARELFSEKENYDNYRIQYLEEQIREIRGLKSEASGANRKIKELMELINESGIEDSLKETRRSFRSFIEERKLLVSTDDGADFEFIVLRRWNSYTPIIADNPQVSKGGGYFLKTPDCGLVIDPGFNFIDNFKAQGRKFHEIDHVLITHAHNDHTTDLESILTLLHRYNENVLGNLDGIEDPEERTFMRDYFESYKNELTEEEKKAVAEEAKKEFAASPRRKRIRLYLPAGVYKKYAPLLDLRQGADYDVVIIKSGDELPLLSPNPPLRPAKEAGCARDLQVTAIAAKHDDLMSDRDSLGFVVRYKDFVLVYTGDTGFSQTIETEYKKIAAQHSGNRVVLLAHLGGFKRYENRFDASLGPEGNWDSFYKNHLGRLGLARLVEILRPGICLISEFGEEFRETRLKLTEIFQRVYDDTIFIPADIGLTLNQDKKVRLISGWDQENNKALQYGFFPGSQLDVYECRVDSSLHYYEKTKVDKTELAEIITAKYYRQQK